LLGETYHLFKGNEMRYCLNVKRDWAVLKYIENKISVNRYNLQLERKIIIPNLYLSYYFLECIKREKYYFNLNDNLMKCLLLITSNYYSQDIISLQLHLAFLIL
jgi:hypothetical protein